MAFFGKILGGGKRKKRAKALKAEMENSNSPSGLGKVFKELDCPVCFNTCIPPIHSCVNGHIICNTCRSNVTHCPSCRDGFSGTRNFFAENFLVNLSQTCRYTNNGCEYLRLKGDNMSPHEQQCMFRPITCIFTPCGQKIPYKSLLSHLSMNHQISGTDSLPADITYHAEQPMISNRKWLPYYIQAFDNLFYVMFEVTRPHFWIFVWLQTTKVEDSYDSTFISTISMKNDDKKLKLRYEGPVHSIRTSDTMIKQDGLCFVAHEVLLQHFNSNGYFTFTVDIKKVSRRGSRDMNDNSRMDLNNQEDTSRQSLNNTSFLYPDPNENLYQNDPNPVEAIYQPAESTKI